jgi:hypothetical protein
MNGLGMLRSQRVFQACLIASCLWFVSCNAPNSSKRTGLGQVSKDAIEHVAEKGPVKLIVRFWPPVPRLSDLVEMDVEVRAEPDVEIKAPAFGQAVGDFLVRDYSETTEQRASAATTSTSVRAQPTAKRFRYKLEPVHAGRHLIRSVAIEFVDNRTNSENRGKLAMIESNPIEIEIASELGDTVPDLAQLVPMISPQPLEQAMPWLWLLLFVPLIGIFATWLWRRRRRKSVLPQLPQKTPAEIAQEALAALLAENLPAQARFQEFYLRLTGIVRHYIEGVTGVRAPELTTEEFLRTMRTRDLFQVDQSLRLQEFLEAADMVKFAGQQPDGSQIELATNRAREFINMRSLASLAEPTATVEV